ncbi:MAG: PleD family two-component system response regulator [Sumerlaeia bacterium]
MSKARILIVDDEEDIRIILKTTLEEEFEVVEAHDGLDALEKLDRYEPDFICLDVMMPLMDGFETCEMIRKNSKYNEIPIMFLTAMGGTQNTKEGYGKGANLYLTKPFEPSRLLKNIRVQLSEHTNYKRKRYTIEELHAYEENHQRQSTPSSAKFEVPDSVSKENLEKIMRSTRQIERGEQKVPKQPKPRVLLVDDDPDLLFLMTQTLDDYAEIITADDGMQAVQNLVKYQPDLLVIDVMIPKMNGLQLCESLRGNKAFSEIPILICSAKCRDKDIAIAKKVGANDFLAKPFETAELVRKFRELQQLPTYRFRANKRMSWADIEAEKAPEPVEDVFEVESTDHRNKLQAMANEAMRQAVDDLEKSEKQGEKKKRRLFGFGGKE